MERKNILPAAVVTVALIAIGAWAIWRYAGRASPETAPPAPAPAPAPLVADGMIRTFDGRVLPDLAADEVGDFADAHFENARRRYLTNLHAYQRLPMAPAHADPAHMGEIIAGVLQTCLADDPGSAEALDALPEGAAERLAQHIAVLLSRMAGLPEREYLARLPDTARILPAPERAVMIDHIRQTWAPDIPPGAEAEGDDAAGHTFSTIYTLNERFDDGSALISAVAADGDGLRCALATMDSSVALPDILVSRMSRDERDFFIGGVAQSHLVMFQPHAGSEAISSRDQTVTWFHLALIVEDRSGDRYPAWFHLYYDPAGQTWWLHSAMRSTSLRALMKPAFVF